MKNFFETQKTQELTPVSKESERQETEKEAENSDEKKRVEGSQEQEKKQELLNTLGLEEGGIKKIALDFLKNLLNSERRKENTKAALLLGLLTCFNASTLLVKNAVALEAKKTAPIESMAKDADTKSDYEVPHLIEIKEQSKIFEREIGILKKIGYKVTPDRLVDTSFLADGFGGEIRKSLEREFENERKLENEIFLDFSDTPTKGLTHLYNGHFSGELNPASNKIVVSPFSIRSRKISDGRILLEVYPRIKSEESIYSKVITEQEASTAAKQIKTILKEQFEKREEIQKTFDSIPSADEIPYDRWPTFSVLKEKTLSEEEKQILKGFESIEIQVIPEGWPTDSEHSRNEILTFDKKQLENFKFLLNINGKIKAIRFKKKVPITEIDENNYTINGKSTYEIHIDANGNTVNESVYVTKTIRTISEDGKTEENKPIEATEELKIVPPIKFKEKAEPEERAENIDLSGASPDLKGLNQFIFARTESPLELFKDSNENEYRFYANINHEEALEKYSRRFPLIKEGVAEADDLFGFNGGANIHILRSEEKNAIFEIENPNSIAVFDSHINGITESNLLNLAFHERIHSLDEQLGICGEELDLHFEKLKKQGIKFENLFFLSGDKEKQEILNKMFSRGLISLDSLPGIFTFGDSPKEKKMIKTTISEYLFFHINEQNFFKEYFEGHGHSQDNTKEFLASFLTTFNYNENTQSDDWENRIMMIPKAHRDQYLETLEVLKSVLEKNKKIPKDAPIFEEMEKKIKFLAEPK